MIFRPTELHGAWLLDIERREDRRGFFARTMCRNEFTDRGLIGDFVQSNVSFNHVRGTLRGMHFQNPPHAEVKLIRCPRGAIWDVIIDLQPGSPTFGRWQGFELSEANQRILYVPENFAHGYQTLVDGTEVTYQVSQFYAPGAEGGIRYDDPAFAIDWPLPVACISDKDGDWPAWRPEGPIQAARTA